MFPEQLVCRVSDFTKEREIVLGRDYGAVPQVDRKRRKTRLNINLCTVPAGESVHGECEAQIVHSRGTAAAGQHSGFTKQFAHHAAKPSA